VDGTDLPDTCVRAELSKFDDDDAPGNTLGLVGVFGKLIGGELIAASAARTFDRKPPGVAGLGVIGIDDFGLDGRPAPYGAGDGGMTEEVDFRIIMDDDDSGAAATAEAFAELI
jgi:hypothetical protein